MTEVLGNEYKKLKFCTRACFTLHVDLSSWRELRELCELSRELRLRFIEKRVRKQPVYSELDKKTLNKTEY